MGVGTGFKKRWPKKASLGRWHVSKDIDDVKK